MFYSVKVDQAEEGGLASVGSGQIGLDLVGSRQIRFSRCSCHRTYPHLSPFCSLLFHLCPFHPFTSQQPAPVEHDSASEAAQLDWETCLYIFFKKLQFLEKDIYNYFPSFVSIRDKYRNCIVGFRFFHSLTQGETRHDINHVIGPDMLVLSL